MKIDTENIIRLLGDAELHPEIGIPTGLSLQDIEAAEARTGVNFPRVFKVWLGEVNAPFVGGGGLVGITSRSILDLETIWEIYPEWKANGWIPVASDGSGNCFVLLSEIESCPVAFIDVSEDPDKLSYLVASDFMVFLKMYILREGGERRWPFNESFVVENDPDIVKLKCADLPWE